MSMASMTFCRFEEDRYPFNLLLHAVYELLRIFVVSLEHGSFGRGPGVVNDAENRLVFINITRHFR